MATPEKKTAKTPYMKGSRQLLPHKQRRQLRNIDPNMRTLFRRLFHRPQHLLKATVCSYLIDHFDTLSAFLLFQPFGMFLQTTHGLMETLIPLGPCTRRALDDWHVMQIGTHFFHTGSLFGLVPVLARLTSQRIVFYIPPKLLTQSDLLHCGPLFRDFTVITIERSIPSWNGHVASMAQVLALAIEIWNASRLSDKQTRESAKPPAKPTAKLQISLFFQKMAATIIEPLGPDIFAMCEILDMEPDQFATAMLDAIDQFIDAKN
jgi:hypothetical protein